MTLNKDDLTGLGTKLDALDLTDGERAALHTIFDAAMPGEEVEGFGMPTPPGPAFNLRLQSPAADSFFDVRTNGIHDIHMNQGGVDE